MATAKSTQAPTQAPASQPSLRKRELRKLIHRAGKGDEEAARRLVSPFVSQGEKLVNFGVSAKFGIIRTYDFVFLSDRQIGDLRITPLSGNLSVGIAYLRAIDVVVLSQPAYPLLLRLFMLSSYLWVSAGLWWVARAITLWAFGDVLFPNQNPTASLLTLGLGYGLWGLAVVLGLFLAFVAVNPAIKRAFLHFKKSGLWLMFRGTPTGLLIFADRNKFEMLTRLTRQVSELKRILDSRSD
jgi:hypothetical protein